MATTKSSSKAPTTPSPWRRNSPTSGRAWRAAALLACLLFGSSTLAQAATRAEQRRDFQRAVAAIGADDMGTFFALEKQLRNYALHDHLRFLLTERTVKRGELAAAEQRARAFADEFGGDFLSWRVVRAYRDRLRKEERWQALLDSADWPAASRMRCQTLRARQALGRLPADASELEALWQQLSPGRDCRWVMDARLRAGQVGPRQLWARVSALMSRGRLEQVRELKPHFNRRDQAVIEAWIVGHDAPAEALADPRWRADSALNRRVFRHLISRLARRDALAARQRWGEAHRAGRYDAETRNQAARTLCLRGASDFVPAALDWLRWLPASAQDNRSRAERARLALRLGRWQEVLDAVDAMPAEQRAESDWIYWRAVAELQLGSVDAGRAALRELAASRSYYGFLAADRLGLRYAFNHAATPGSPELRQQLQGRRDVQRMREYLFVGLRAEATAVWRAVVAELDAAQRAELSLLALDWGWYDRAIASNARTSHRDDLRVRFPFAYRELVQREADEHGLSWHWVYGVARRESLFQPDVRSGAGAVGLMQLMPATARDVAGRAGVELKPGTLQDPASSLALGSYYLGYLSARFDGHEVMATAAYNGGPSRVSRWLADAPMDADRWVESIPIRETREYVKAVMAYAAVYDWRDDGELQRRLSQRMPPLPAAAP